MFNKIILAIAALIILAIFFTWLSERDEKLNTWASAYERCVCNELDTTPSNYYVRYGEYPRCDATLYLNWEPSALKMKPCGAEINR